MSKPGSELFHEKQRCRPSRRDDPQAGRLSSAYGSDASVATTPPPDHHHPLRPATTRMSMRKRKAIGIKNLGARARTRKSMEAVKVSVSRDYGLLATHGADHRRMALRRRLRNQKM